MVLKTWSFAFLLFLIMLSSVAVHSEEITGIYGKPVEVSSTKGSTEEGVYYGSGYNPSSQNLLIGGISQVSQNPDLNSEFYRKVADNNQAIYVPTYFSGDQLADATAVNEAARSSPEYPQGASYLNGLTSPALNNQVYDTIIAYSGGTTSVVTAMANQKVTANTLILISPMRGGAGRVETGNYLGLGDDRVNFDWDVEFEQKIQAILAAGTKIVIIQSDQDDPSIKKEIKYAPDINIDVGDLFQYKFTKDEWPKEQWPSLTIHDVNLDSTGNDAHWEIFADYATAITNGEYVPPTPEPNPESTPKTTPKTNMFQKFAQMGLTLGAPLLSPYSTSDTSGFSSQNKEGPDVPETSGATYLDKANDVWYVDAFSWSGDRNLLEKPAAPYRFVSGEINTYGYNWIYLPFEQTGLKYSPGYVEWVTDTLASMGISAPTAGYGLLIDEGQNGGGSW